MVTTEKIVIKDIKFATELIRLNYSRNKIPSVMEVINQGQSIDPNNALYNYLKARLYLIAGKDEKALREIEEGVGKKYLTLYSSELRRAAAKVIKSAGASKAQIETVANTRIMALSFINNRIWDSLSKLAEQCEEQRNYDRADRIYKLVIQMTWQADTERVLPEGGSGGVDNEAFERLAKLRKKRFKELIDKVKQD